MKSRLPVITTLVTLLLMAAACGHKERDYSSWAEIPEAGWAYGDTLTLIPADSTLADNDSLVTRRLTLGVVHSSSYPYSNLWLEVTYHSPGHMHRDTVNMTMADIYGRWLGSGFGTSYQREITISPRAEIDLTRPVEIRHIMRLDTLPAIERVGIGVF